LLNARAFIFLKSVAAIFVPLIQVIDKDRFV